MIPRTFPSTINTDTGKRQMVVYFITDITGLQRWKDYIPVKFVLDATPTEASYNNDGYIAIDELSSISGKQSWLDYVPVYLDNSATDAWEVDSTGFIQIGLSGIGGVPYTLFANNEQGAWYDPSDMSTLFQNQAGTTPVTAVEQPVSLMLDKSKGGGVIGADTVVNGTFAADSDWTKGTGWSIGSGVATKIVGTASLLSQSATLIVGRSYLITYTITRTAGTLTGQLTGGTTVSGTARDAAGTYTDMLTAVSGNNAIAFSADAVFVGTVDNVTLRLLPAGNHAYTPSTATASRPVLSARVNLLTKTEQFDDAYWSKSGTTVIANTTTAPDETLTADSLFETNGAGFHTVSHTSVSKSANNIVYTSLLYFKPNGRTRFYFQIQSDATNGVYCIVEGSGSGTIVTNSTTFGTGWTAGNATITTDSNGFYKITLSGTSDTKSTIFTQVVLINSGTNSSYTGDITKGIYIWGADLRVANDGVGIPSYQRVDTSTSYDTVGFPLYLRADGTDDYMLTNSIDFSGTDKMTVWAGVRKLSDAASALLFENSADPGVNLGTFTMLAPSANGANSYRYSPKGTGPAIAGTGVFAPAPTTNVLTGISEISTDTAILRVNGLQNATDTTDQGTGNYGNYPLYLFRRAGTSLPFNGRCYSLIVRGAQSSTAEITSGESYVNTKTRAY
jgi:hypothetical protein